MIEKKISVDYKEYVGIEDLSQSDKLLLQEALKAAQNAYAPYSKFNVGAAVLLKDNAIITGNNQENAAYPSGICAERVALFYASSQKPGMEVVKIAIVAPDSPADWAFPITPCGACRQVMAEYESLQQKPVEIILWAGRGPVWVFRGITHLLPFYFSTKSLGH
jgi:cytidine deaminase